MLDSWVAVHSIHDAVGNIGPELARVGQQINHSRALSNRL
jgi:hypothetical protein